MRGGGCHFNIDDGYGVYRLRAAMRSNVVLRGDSNNKPDIRNTVCRRGCSTVGMRGVLGVKSNIKPIL